jgi:hypothetical protein
MPYMWKALNLKQKHRGMCELSAIWNLTRCPDLHWPLLAGSRGVN